jgi:F-type H+-transporting ATPase subunit b
MNPLVQPDPGLFIWTIATFLLLLFLLGKFAWKPLLAALDSRRDLITKSLDDAVQAKQELERLQRESAEIIRQARIEAEGIIARGRADAEKLNDQLRQKAREEADGIVRNAGKNIEQETRRALQEIRNEAASLSVMIASKILQRQISKEDNERLIEETLKQIGTSVQ